MNTSLYDIDRSTHLKILVVAAVAAAMFVAIAANARSDRSLRAVVGAVPAVRMAPPLPRPTVQPDGPGVVRIALALPSP